MFSNIDSFANKERIAIVVVGYNKVIGLKRLLYSLNKAEYEYNDIPLLISIDASNNQQVYQLANEFEWHYGKKYVNIQGERLGLKNHIFQCADLTKHFKGVILLEDDILISPYFYYYAECSLNYYGNNDRVAGISLYKNETNGFIGLPFQPEENQYDVFAWQTVSSWGELWNEKMWYEFKKWLSNWDGDYSKVNMPQIIKDWTRAWSKYFYAYIIATDKYFIFPYTPLSTNFNDAGGEHSDGNKSVVQVSLLQGRKEYRFGLINDLVKYDVYGNNMKIPEWLGLNRHEIVVDPFGIHDEYNGRYILATCDLPFHKIKGYSFSMRPWELNIKYEVDGDDLILYDCASTQDASPKKRKIKDPVISYFLRDFNLQVLANYLWHRFFYRLFRKLHIHA